MIPKKIHYVWFGRGEKSDKIKHCIESWKKYLPDYEIKEWNEDNFDYNYNDFTRKAYKEKKFLRERTEKSSRLNAEKSNLQTELSNLKGLFTGRRRREIEARLAQIESELSKL